MIPTVCGPSTLWNLLLLHLHLILQLILILLLHFLLKLSPSLSP